jgi:hypothetical protein
MPVLQATNQEIIGFGVAWPKLPAVRSEAASLVKMVGRYGASTSLKSIRQLIAVPPKIETIFRAYAQAVRAESALESGAVLRVVRWRERVLAEFNRLLRSSKPASHLSPKSRLQRSPRPR